MMQAKNSIINFLKAYFFVAVLWVLVLFSAVSVVYSVFDSRVKFDALESLRLEQMALQVSWKLSLNQPVFTLGVFTQSYCCCCRYWAAWYGIW